MALLRFDQQGEAAQAAVASTFEAKSRQKPSSAKGFFAAQGLSRTNRPEHRGCPSFALMLSRNGPRFCKPDDALARARRAYVLPDFSRSSLLTSWGAFSALGFRLSPSPPSGGRGGLR